MSSKFNKDVRMCIDECFYRWINSEHTDAKLLKSHLCMYDFMRFLYNHLTAIDDGELVVVMNEIYSIQNHHQLRIKSENRIYSDYIGDHVILNDTDYLALSAVLAIGSIKGTDASKYANMWCRISTHIDSVSKDGQYYTIVYYDIEENNTSKRIILSFR